MCRRPDNAFPLAIGSRYGGSVSHVFGVKTKLSEARQLATSNLLNLEMTHSAMGAAVAGVDFVRVSFFMNDEHAMLVTPRCPLYPAA